MAELEMTNLAREADSEEGREAAAQELAPTDGGAAAWKFLGAAFMIEALLWGFPANFGVFQSYYSEHPSFKDSPDIASIGTVSTSLYFLGAPFITPVVRRFHRWQRHMIVVGWAVCCLSLVGASFADSVPALIGLQGVLYGAAFTLIYFPVLNMLNEWWVRRRGLAYGVLFAGAGLSGIAYPFVLETLLSRFGYRVALRGVAVMMAVAVGPMLFMLKGRLPHAQRGVMAISSAALEYRLFLQQPLFWVFAVSNMFQGFSYFIPSLYLPSFSSLMGFSSTSGALLLAIFNLAQVFGMLAFGFVSDRVDNILTLVFVSSFVGSVASFTLWGFANSLAMLAVFAAVYGSFAGAFPVLWPKFGSVLCDDPQNVFSLMAFGKGIGNLATGPITARLLTGSVDGGYGLGKFEPLILFLGGSMFCSSLGILGWPLKRKQLST